MLVYIAVALQLITAGFGALTLIKVSFPVSARVLFAPALSTAFVTCALVASRMLGFSMAIGITATGIALAGFAVAGLVAAFRCKDLRPWSMIAAMLLLPVIPMYKFFRVGLSEYVGSYFPDGWNYVLYAQFLLDGEHTRTPLYAQWVQSGMSQTRFSSGAWIGFFARYQPDAFAGQGPYLAWLVFVLAASSAALGYTVWRVIDWRVWTVAAFSVVSPAIVGTIELSNFDTLLAASMVPALIASVLLATPSDWRLAMLSGVLAGAIFCAQIEVVPLALLIPAAVVASRIPGAPVGWLRWGGMAVAVAAFAAAPWLSAGSQFLMSQLAYLANTRATLPGDQYYLTMVDLRCALPAAWALYDPWNLCVGIAWDKLLLAAGLLALMGLGAAALFWRLPGLVIGALVMVGLAISLVASTGYPYPVFKLIAMLTGAAILLAVHGMSIVMQIRPRWAIAICAVLAVGLLANVSERMRQFDGLIVHKDITEYRWVTQAQQSSGAGLKIAVEQPAHFMWAVFFLRDATFDPSIYKLPLFAHAAAKTDRPQTMAGKFVVTDGPCETPIKQNAIYKICSLVSVAD